MTDNRTNEPTEAQVEAAAKAICETRPHSGGGSLVIYEDAVDFARAALAAAAALGLTAGQERENDE